MQVRFKKKSQLIDIGITALAVALSIGTMLCLFISLLCSFLFRRDKHVPYVQRNV